MHRKDHFYQGLLYHLLVDPALHRVRRRVHGQVAHRSTLIDIGSGTGELLFCLADWCSHLVGVEVSKRMWSFATRRARGRGLGNVNFILGDGSRLEEFPAASFDYGSACMVLHEMDEDQRIPVLEEMKRVTRTLILVDYQVALPVNFEAAVCRVIERLAGRRHFRNFTSFLDTGGLVVLLEQVGLTVKQNISFQRGCFHLVQSA
jgi:demethylmenaquinone methyltransferase/2-methoxy-6-polyprenyl-1,4-benzoquinol methylase